MAELSEWLKIMLGEVSRKRDEQSRAMVESKTRASESQPDAPQPTTPASA